MSFEDQAKIAGRQVLYMLEIELDWCSNTYGQAPCTASAQNECYQTRFSCQDPPNWNPLGETRTYRFMPMGSHPNLHSTLTGTIPSMSGEPSIAPSEAEPASLGRRGSVAVQLFDMIAPDNIDTDPYWETRPRPPNSTWWGRFKARHEFYVGRPMRIYEGYANRPLADWRVRNYQIEEISGPTTDGIVTIRGKDPLKLLDGDRALIPEPAHTTLNGSINPNVTTIDVVDSSDFANGDEIIIDDELILIGTVGVNQFTGCTRGYRDTNNVSHSDGADVSKVSIFTDAPPEDVIEAICLTAGLPASYIPKAEWQTETATFLPGLTLSGVIARPIAARKLLNDEILPQTNIALFWDEFAQLIRLRVGSAFQNVTVTLNEEDHIVDGRVQIKDEPRRQVTTCQIWYGPQPGTVGDVPDKDNMQFFEAFTDAAAEGADQYDRRANREFASRFFLDATDANDVQFQCQLWVKRFATMPQIMQFDIDAKDADRIRLGDVIDVQTDAYVGLRGERRLFRGQVLTEKPVIPGHRYTLQLLKYFPPSSVTIPVQINISADTNNYDLWVALGGPPDPVEITVVVDAGVTVSSTTPLSPAFTTGQLHPDSVVILARKENAIITGMGGTGGSGVLTPPDAQPGGKGGIAVEFNCDGTVENDNSPTADTGYIGGGGGGGGAGGDVWASTDIGGGGGGAGINGGNAGTGVGTGGNGSAGTALTGGGSGAVSVGTAGNGGDLGQSGQTGQLRIEVDVTDIFRPIPGGEPGAAIALNGNNVSIIDAGTGLIVGPVTG